MARSWHTPDMAEGDTGNDQPSLELPKLGLRRRKKQKAEAETAVAPPPPPVAKSAHVPVQEPCPPPKFRDPFDGKCR